MGQQNSELTTRAPLPTRRRLRGHAPDEDNVRLGDVLLHVRAEEQVAAAAKSASETDYAQAHAATSQTRAAAAVPRRAALLRRGLACAVPRAAAGCAARGIGRVPESCCGPEGTSAGAPTRPHAPGGKHHLVQTRLIDRQLGRVPRVDARLADVDDHHLESASRGAEGPSAQPTRAASTLARANLDLGAASAGEPDQMSWS